MFICRPYYLGESCVNTKLKYYLQKLAINLLLGPMERNTKTTVTLELDRDTLIDAEKILASLPCSLDYACNLFLQQVVKEGMIPFENDGNELKRKQEEENLRLVYGEVNYQDTAEAQGLFDMGPETSF